MLRQLETRHPFHRLAHQRDRIIVSFKQVIGMAQHEHSTWRGQGIEAKSDLQVFDRGLRIIEKV